ncbi:uncharacterized protein BX663DRAFT_460396 [Cokeromyces recurvatus]|uniref:uncharacterized protein n=1 Tax=Cokeromyces recurvatus TaxID=90255 RepID=UPI002220E601|nr:uncharacterized protein BX663DRAFT_460396 [Cokeromyces recurvatus]KAI7899397.1 hypothetical protein BX663DRAFT_460396 [Cokeromyces recurvatus]
MHSKHTHSVTATNTSEAVTPALPYTMSNNNNLSQINQQNNPNRTIAVNYLDVELFLTRCGLSQYYDVFIEEGFDRTESLLEITESDLIQMQVKRGHRRLLQRAITNAKGIPSTVPLQAASNFNTKDLATHSPAIPIKHRIESNPSSEITLAPPPLLPQQQLSTLSSSSSSIMTSMNNSYPITPMLISSSSSSNAPSTPISHSSSTSPNKMTSIMSFKKNIEHMGDTSMVTNKEYFPSAGTATTQSGMSSTEEEAVTNDNIHRLWKRKYYRHAKPDTNAPLKPPSAYVMFSNDVRAELKQQNKSFTDLAKIIGDRWKNISPEKKEVYETNAFKSREEYIQQVEKYQKTDAYKNYQQYLSDFKAENEAAARPVGRPRKRHKRDEDKELSDEAVSDSTKQVKKTPLISSQADDNHQKITPTYLDQRQYPFYLLNEDSSRSSPLLTETTIANNDPIKADSILNKPLNLSKKSSKRHTPKKKVNKYMKNISRFLLHNN